MRDSNKGRKVGNSLPIALFEACLDDLQRLHGCLDDSVKASLVRRLKCEQLGFVAKLNTLRKAFLARLEDGITPIPCSELQMCVDAGLGGCLHASATIIQITSLFSKYQVPAAKPDLLPTFHDLQGNLSSTVLAGIVDRITAFGDLRVDEPYQLRMATGATYDQSDIPERCGFPLFALPSFVRECMYHYTPYTPGHKPVRYDSRPCQVPKDFDKDRLIFIEPYERQAMQQVLMLRMYSRLHAGWSRPNVDLYDTSKGHRLISGENHKRYATIDLSDASDRISKAQVWKAFRGLPQMRSWLFACAPKTVEGKSIKTFNSMGCGTCFPVMTMMFTAMLAALSDQCGCSLDFRVYGDDLIVRIDDYDHVMSALAAMGYKPNLSKSFVRSPYRETCGIETFNGVDITPLRIRVAPTFDTHGIARSISLSNDAYAKGMLSLSESLAVVARQAGVPCTPYCSVLGLKTRTIDTVEITAQMTWSERFQAHALTIPTEMPDRPRHKCGDELAYWYWLNQAQVDSVYGKKRIQNIRYYF